MASVSPAALEVQRDAAVWLVRLNRPTVGNAINSQMIAELTAVLQDMSRQGAAVLVLEGAGDVFCMGADFAEIAASAEGGVSGTYSPEDFFDLLHELALGDFVTISHVQGKANAGGLGFIAASDIVIADENATFGLSELLFGLIPAIIQPFLIRRVGFQHAHHLACSAQPIGAQQAAEWGLADVVGPHSRVILSRYLSRLRRISPSSVRLYKSYLREIAPIDTRTRQTAVRFNREMFANSDSLASIRRFAERGLFPWEAGEAD